MPYNSSASSPHHEATGTTQLPLSRIKKIIGTDQDINMCSNNAAFVITLATEMFIQYMAESGHNVVKSERKPRRNIQYRDLSNAVAHTDNLEFLTDIVPRTVPLKLVKANAHLAHTLIPAKSTVPPTIYPSSTPSNTHAGPSGTNSFPPPNPNDNAPPRVPISGLLDSASAPPSAPNLIQSQPQAQTQNRTKPPTPTHQTPLPIHHTNGFTPANATTSNSFTPANANPSPSNSFTPANKPRSQKARSSSAAATRSSVEDEDPNAQLRMESQANSEEQEDVEMS